MSPKAKVVVAREHLAKARQEGDELDAEEIALAEAALNERERRMVERIVARLREELGTELLAVWLYGSRARGEADPNEADPDLRSDVDLLAIVDSSRDTGEVARWALPMVEAEAECRHERGEQPLGVEGRHRRQAHALILFAVASYCSRSSRNRRDRAFAAS